MNDAVHLEGSRCNGEAHGGCQTDCSFFGKEQWLHPAGAGVQSVGVGEASTKAPRCTVADLNRATRRKDEGNSAETWVCQATRLLDATQPLPGWNARQYLRDVTSGNWHPRDLAKVLIFAGYRPLALGIGYRALTWAYEFKRRWTGGLPLKREGGPIPVGHPTPAEDLNLQAGELVEVKPLEEILPTLNQQSYNRGMRFDKEMAAYCGQRFRVLRRVDRILDEPTGKMVVMKPPASNSKERSVVQHAPQDASDARGRSRSIGVRSGCGGLPDRRRGRTAPAARSMTAASGTTRRGRRMDRYIARHCRVAATMPALIRP